ncbi:MAG: hypothetical protein IJS47_05380 [Clostridia bacterium]|nr:hypothetical protein [Clostridia bacterium]
MYIDRDKVLYGMAIALVVLCAIFLGYDIWKVAKVEVGYLETTTNSRVSVSKSKKELKYKPTNNVVEHGDEIFEAVKEVAFSLNSTKKGSTNTLEIKNIQKIQEYFLEYKKYLVVKYKLINIIEDIPNLYRATSGASNESKTQYFLNNKDKIEKIYGIKDKDTFVDFANTLGNFNNGRVVSASIRISSIVFDVDNHDLMFNFVLFSSKDKYIEYAVTSSYYDFTDNQVAPFVAIRTMEDFD